MPADRAVDGAQWLHRGRADPSTSFSFNEMSMLEDRDKEASDWYLALAYAFTVGFVPSAAGQTANPNRLPDLPALGRYANTLSQICGAKQVDVHPPTIPKIGCFAIGAGSSLDGVLKDRRVSIRVAADGNETYIVDGLEIRTTGLGITNDPRVRPGSSGYMFCRDDAHADCPAMINSLVRQPGQFATFDVSRQVRPRVYVTNEENWKAETDH